MRLPSVRCFRRQASPDCVLCPCTTEETRLGSWREMGVGRGGEAFPDRKRIAAFNGSLSKRWNRFITDARRAANLADFRESIGTLFAGAEYFKAVEPQRRMALHLHVVLRVNRIGRVDDRLRGALQVLAIHHGFGCQIDLRVIGGESLDAPRVARYVAKYVSKTSDLGRRLPMPERNSRRKCCNYRRCSPRRGQRGEVRADGRRLIRSDPSASGGTRLEANPHHLATSHQHPRKRVRTWTASRGWGLSMRSLTASQQAMARGESDVSAQLLANSLGVDVEIVRTMRTASARWRADTTP